MDAAEPETTLDRLAGEWWIHQLRRGHRYASDDLIVAWTALRARPQARRVLDLGAGVGSVGLLTLLGLGERAQLVSVEAQAQSAALLRRTLQTNGLQDRVSLLEMDLRELGAPGQPTLPPMDLVVANPPFLPPGSATPSPNPQRAAARLELRGDIFDYARVAARLLSPEGRLCFCHAIQDPRPAAAVAAAGMRLFSRRELRFREGRPFGLAIYLAGWTGETEEGEPAPLFIRDAAGDWSEAWRAVRRDLLIAL